MTGDGGMAMKDRMRNGLAVGAVALLLLCILNQSSGSFNPFIYFRF